MSHKHQGIIKKALDLWPDCVMFVNGPHTKGGWFKREQGANFPSFDVRSKYVVVPSKHEDVAYAFYVEGGEVEVWIPSDDGRCGHWGAIEKPTFNANSLYRIKPELPDFYRIGDKFMLGSNLYILAATGEVSAALINMHSGMRYDDPIPRGSRGGNEVSAQDLAEYRGVTEQELFNARVDVKVGELVK